MKRLLTLFIAILTILTATAQEEYPIILDKASLRKMVSQGTDNANIDPIRKDSSRKPCARIKIRFANMSRAEVDELKIERKSNTDLVRQEILFYDNVLILEMTARPDTRFYVQSDTYGQSNEVSLNLEGNCEYEMEARLNSRFSIVVKSNVAGAEVYIDGVKQKETDATNEATIDDVMVGTHNLKVSYKGISAEQTIEVRKGSISFTQEIDKSALEPQFVAFEITPKNAQLIVDNKQLTLTDGTTSIVKGPGQYRYKISAKYYHTQEGEFTVAGSKVVKHITLQPAFGFLSVGGGNLKGAEIFVDDESIGTAPITSYKLASGEHTVRVVLDKYKPYAETITIKDTETTPFKPTLSADFATVTLKAPNDATIWVNDVQKGKGSWTGELSTGIYIFEARKEGHNSKRLSKEIIATPAVQSYALEAPTPIIGVVNINSTPAMADIYIDGKFVGSTPMKVNNVLIGNHTLRLTRKDFNDYTQTFTVAEGETTNINATLTKKSAPAPAPASTPASLPSASGSYKIGDVVNIGNVRGVVFQTSPQVKVVSVMEASHIWSNENVDTGATDKYDGKANLAKIKSISGWQSKYPAHKWCTDLGEGWYLPAQNELETINRQKDAINNALKSIDFPELGSTDSYTWMWSSTEHLIDKAYYFKYNGGYSSTASKYLTSSVRAVYVVRSSSNAASASAQAAQSTPSANIPTSKKIGDFDMVYVKGGTFTMGATAEQGSDAQSDEKPTHSVTVSDFYIGKYEVTQAQWKAVMGSNPSYFKGDNLPVEWVSWDDIQEFIKKLNAKTGKRFRLPTEAEWEYAARGGNQSKGYKYSGSNSVYDVAWYYSNSDNKTHPVGQKRPNELGIYDMSGNVFEWCQDWEGNYSSSSQTNPSGPSSGTCRVLRGGCWVDYSSYSRVSYRLSLTPGSRKNGSGFRLACSVEPQPAAPAQQPKPATTPAPVSKTYKVGDYYNVNGKEGVVFEVSADGRHGKIVSLKQSGALMWAAQSAEQSRTIGTDYKSDGTKNIAKIREISGWQSKFPAFKWCANLGSGWYLPSIEELKKLMLTKSVRDVVNRTLVSKGQSKMMGTKFWSSTEFYEQGVPNKRIFIINLEDECTDRTLKSSLAYVRAISKF